MHGLGDAVPLTGEVLAAVSARLHEDPSRVRPLRRRRRPRLPRPPGRGHRDRPRAHPRLLPRPPAQPRPGGEPAGHGPGPRPQHQVRAAHRRQRRLRGRRCRLRPGAVRAGALRGARERPVVPGHPLLPRGRRGRCPGAGGRGDEGGDPGRRERHLRGLRHGRPGPPRSGEIARRSGDPGRRRSEGGVAGRPRPVAGALLGSPLPAAGSGDRPAQGDGRHDPGHRLPRGLQSQGGASPSLLRAVRSQVLQVLPSLTLPLLPPTAPTTSCP